MDFPPCGVAAKEGFPSRGCIGAERRHTAPSSNNNLFPGIHRDKLASPSSAWKRQFHIRSEPASCRLSVMRPCATERGPAVISNSNWESGPSSLTGVTRAIKVSSGTAALRTRMASIEATNKGASGSPHPCIQSAPAVCAANSISNAAGTMGFPGKWSLKNHSPESNRHVPMPFASRHSKVSKNRNPGPWGVSGLFIFPIVSSGAIDLERVRREVRDRPWPIAP